VATGWNVPICQSAHRWVRWIVQLTNELIQECQFVSRHLPHHPPPSPPTPATVIRYIVVSSNMAVLCGPPHGFPKMMDMEWCTLLCVDMNLEKCIYRKMEICLAQTTSPALSVMYVYRNSMSETFGLRIDGVTPVSESLLSRIFFACFDSHSVSQKSDVRDAVSPLRFWKKQLVVIWCSGTCFSQIHWNYAYFYHLPLALASV